MKKSLGRLALIGAVSATVAGVAVAVVSYLRDSGLSNEEVVHISFDDNTEQTLTANTMEAQEFTDIARKLVGLRV